MNLLSNAFRFLAMSCALAIFLSAQDSPVDGRVIDGDGKPVPGVLVTGLHKFENGYISNYAAVTKTAQDGQYSVFDAHRVIFFRKLGYRPLTLKRLPSDRVVDISLEREDSGWKLNSCLADSAGQKYGINLMFQVPRGTKVIKDEPPSDAVAVSIVGPGKAAGTLHIMSGWNLGGGLTYVPDASWYLDGTKITERSDPHPGAIDVRGKMPNGKNWRSLSVYTDIAEYHGVSDEEARFFDSILDSACLDPEMSESRFYRTGVLTADR